MLRWDLFCTVVDNFGDIGICWRLARQLAAEHSASVRLWVDDLATFARLCPRVDPSLDCQQVEAIEVRKWAREFPDVDVADVVIEAFACELPPSYVAHMASRRSSPVWINLEYLSAEEWIEDCHQVASPQPEWGLTKYFFFPGFTSRTGGLLRERDLLAQRAAFQGDACADFWQRLGLVPPDQDERRISMFCYQNPALLELLRCWETSSTRVTVLAAVGAATEQCQQFDDRERDTADGPTVAANASSLSLPTGSRRLWQRGALTVYSLPFLEHADFDRLLWACDVNFVRGEDSFVRAQWAQRPFVWQPYPQADDAHQLKLAAFLLRYLKDAVIDLEASSFADSTPTSALRDLWLAWNGTGQIAPAWHGFERHFRAIEQHQVNWVRQLDRVGELTNNLARFVAELERREFAAPPS